MSNAVTTEALELFLRELGKSTIITKHAYGYGDYLYKFDLDEFQLMLQAHGLQIAALSAGQAQPVGYGYGPEMQSGKGGFWVLWEPSNTYDTAVYIAPAHPPVQVPVVKEGWKLVPIEPTQAMLDEACRSDPHPIFKYTKVEERDGSVPLIPITTWRAMLAAAPLPASPEQGEKE